MPPPPPPPHQPHRARPVGAILYLYTLYSSKFTKRYYVLRRVLYIKYLKSTQLTDAPGRAACLIERGALDSLSLRACAILWEECFPSRVAIRRQ